MMGGNRVWTAVTSLVIATVLAGVSPAHAYTVVDDDETRVDLRGAGQGSTRMIVDDQGELGGRFDLDFARLIASGVHKGEGAFFLQLGAKSGVASLLDARLSLDVAEPLSVQVGRFKAPVSAEYLTSATDLLATRRAALNSLVMKRAAGGQIVYTPFDSGESGLDVHVGMFSPTSLTQPPAGAVGVTRVRYRATDALSVHGAIAEHVLAQNRLPEPDRDSRAFSNNRQVDVAVQYDDDTWRGLLEGVYVGDGPEDTRPMGLYAHGARTFSAGEYDLQPGVAYDYRTGTDGELHRGTAVLNALWSGTKLMTSLEYALEYEGGGVGHVGTLSVQAAF